MASMYTLARAMARRRKPPPPGYRHAQNEMRSGAGYQRPQQVLHDGAVSPAGTGPFRRPRRGRTNPTPGSVLRRRNPTPN
jgi:hypothetical protein